MNLSRCDMHVSDNDKDKHLSLSKGDITVVCLFKYSAYFLHDSPYRLMEAITCSGYEFFVRYKDYKHLPSSVGLLPCPLHGRLKFSYVMPLLEGLRCNVTLVQPFLTSPHLCYFHCCFLHGMCHFITICNYCLFS